MREKEINPVVTPETNPDLFVLFLTRTLSVLQNSPQMCTTLPVNRKSSSFCAVNARCRAVRVLVSSLTLRISRLHGRRRGVRRVIAVGTSTLALSRPGRATSSRVGGVDRKPGFASAITTRRNRHTPRVVEVTAVGR